MMTNGWDTLTCVLIIAVELTSPAPLSTLPDGISSRRFRNAHHHRF